MEPIVIFNQVTFCYPHTERPAIEEISFSINVGEFVALIGPTGAGKSTLCYCFNGVVPRLFNGSMAGMVTVAGLDSYQNDIPILAEHVGLVVQNARTQLFNVTVLQEVAFGCENLGLPRRVIQERIAEALDFVGLTGFEDREPATLSGGQQQRVAIACVLAMNPDVLILDEPTSELDPIGSEQVMEVIARLNKELNKTIFLVTHDMEFVATYATRVLVLNHGRLVEDNSPEIVFSQASLLKEARIRPPQVCEVMSDLREQGYRINQIPITLESTVRALQELRDGI
ncbi:MAG TPA: ATP-binding cassette domain-containing protein [Anaerolineaceae bacterium]|nr:ATP-binding cassette domain-containing protein [Anaerolineaceae bacterium]